MKIRKLYSVKLLLIAFVLYTGPALSTGIRTFNRFAIERIINEKLEEANKDAADSGIELQFQYGATEAIATKLANHFEQRTDANVMNSLTQELLIKQKRNHGLVIGHMDVSFEIGLPIFFKDEAKIKNQHGDNAYYAYLKYINIKEDFRGQGYSSKALAIFHDFLDRLGIDYVALNIVSIAPYAGKTYIDAGYNFIDQTIADIEKWAATKGVKKDAAVAKFLEDSSQKLEGTVPYMIRHGKKK